MRWRSIYAALWAVGIVLLVAGSGLAVWKLGPRFHIDRAGTSAAADAAATAAAPVRPHLTRGDDYYLHVKIIEVDGDKAGSESYVFATLHRQDGDKVIQHSFWARYVDKWSKRDGDWAIDRRDCIVDYGTIGEVTPLPGNPASRRDEGDPSYGVLRAVAPA